MTKVGFISWGCTFWVAFLFYVQQNYFKECVGPHKVKKKFWPPELLNLKSFGCAVLDVCYKTFVLNFFYSSNNNWYPNFFYNTTTTNNNNNNNYDDYNNNNNNKNYSCFFILRWDQRRYKVLNSIPTKLNNKANECY